MKITNRPYAGERDLQRVLDFRRACSTRETMGDYPTVSDLRALLASSLLELRKNVRLWEDTEGKLIAFAIVHLPYCNLYFYIHPGIQDHALEAEIIEWGLVRARAFGQAYDQPVTLDTSCRDNNPERIALLECHGFVCQEEQMVYMERALAEPIPEPDFPEGFIVRHPRGEHEVEAYVAMHHEAFKTRNMTVQHRLSMLRSPDYRPELDLIAVAPDGTCAAFCVCHINQEANAKNGRKEGKIGIIGTRPAFRNRGLGRAMLLVALQQLKAREMEVALVGTESWNTTAQRIFSSVGFRTTYRTLWFSKEVE